MKVQHGRRGDVELLVFFDGSVRLVNAMAMALFMSPPPGYGAERLSVFRQRGKRRGSRYDGMVVLFHKTGVDEPKLTCLGYKAWAKASGLCDER